MAHCRGRKISFSWQSEFHSRSAAGRSSVVPPTQVAEFASHMTRATVDWTLEVYGGALHGFTQTELAGAGVPGHDYDARADERSWRAMTELLGDVFGR